MTLTKNSTDDTHNRIRFALGKCSLGAILLAASDIGICAIAMDDNPKRLIHELQERFPQAELLENPAEFEPKFEQWLTTIINFVETPAIDLDLPLDLRGTVFQQKVWQALRQIPRGTTVRYAEIAQRIGKPNAVRAVAGACAANSLALAIPCHRVVRADGKLSGYRWGLERKAELLRREREA